MGVADAFPGIYGLLASDWRTSDAGLHPEHGKEYDKLSVRGRGMHRVLRMHA